MREIRIAIWGLGAMGSGIARMIAKKQGIHVTGVCDKWDKLVGKDLYEVLELEQGANPDVVISAEPSDIIDESKCDVVILATDSFVAAQMEKIKFCLERRVNVISTAEEMAWPSAQNPELAHEMDELAKKNGVSILGTGVNPGFVLDYLILALSGTCEHVESVKATRINDLAPFGRAVMHEQGVGLTLEEFWKRENDGTLAGHVGFPESVGMIAAGLGLEVAELKQTKEPIVTTLNRKSAYGEALQGNVAGIRQQVFAGTHQKRDFFHLDHPQQICPEMEDVDTGDYITINAGDYDMNLQIKPETPGGIGTIAMIVNMIPQLISASPGLKTMLDLPVAHAIVGDFRDQLATDLVDQRRKEGDYVVIEQVILDPSERAPKLPADTASMTMIALLKGYLQSNAIVGEIVTIRTMSGRLVTGKLTDRNPSPEHTYGEVVPELLQIRNQVRDLLEQQFDA